MRGCFLVSENENEEFDIKCSLRQDVTDKVPDEQCCLYVEVENTCNIIKALNKTDDVTKRKYFDKLLSLAQVGLVPLDGAQPKMALLSLEKLKSEIILIEGKRIKNQYMKRLGIIALILSLIVGIISIVCYQVTNSIVFSMIGYTWVGAMSGAWISYGARKFQLNFDDMALIEKDMMEPTIRLIYIGICALVFELFLTSGIITIKLGNITTDSLIHHVELQLLIGILCGLVESKIGVRIYKQATSTLDFENLDKDSSNTK